MRFHFPSAIAGAGFGGLLAATVAMQQRSLHRTTDVPTTTTTTTTTTADDLFATVGAPTLPVSVKRLNENLVVLYDRRLRIPLYACERHRKGDKVDHRIDRKDSIFFAPSDEDEAFRPSNDDYMHSGFDRGHLAPASAFKASRADMDSTFNLANIAPQVGVGFNRHFWARFEAMAKTLNRQFDEVYVLTGTALLPSPPQEGQRASVHYDVLGRGQVAVPTHFWKILVAVRTDKDQRSVSTAAFLMPNAAIDADTPLESFLVDQRTIESATGMRFFPALKDTKPLCDNKELCKLPAPDWWQQAEKDATTAAPATTSAVSMTPSQTNEKKV